MNVFSIEEFPGVRVAKEELPTLVSDVIINPSPFATFTLSEYPERLHAFTDAVVIPYINWELNEGVVIEGMVNALEKGAIMAFKGPTVDFYQKADPSRASYIVIKHYITSEEEEQYLILRF